MHFFTLDTRSDQAPGCLFSPYSLCDVYRFAKKMNSTLRRQNKDVVACASRYNGKLLTNTALLIGGFMILGKGVDLESVKASFAALADFFVPYTDPSNPGDDGGLTVVDCWTAMSHANSHKWIDVSRHLSQEFYASHDHEEEISATNRLDMEECIHYSDPLNANLNIVLPGKLLYIPSPVDLPDEWQWMDNGPTRLFSPAFYADLFGEFNVVLVVCLEKCDYDRAPFIERGIGIEELHLCNDAPEILRAADRFLSLLRAAPGTVAIHGGEQGLHYAGTLVSAHMMSRLGFGAADAAAWMRMACPALLVPPEYLTALSDDAGLLLVNNPAAASSAFLRCFSAPQNAPCAVATHQPTAVAASAAAPAAPAAAPANPARPPVAWVRPVLNRALSLPQVIL